MRPLVNDNGQVREARDVELMSNGFQSSNAADYYQASTTGLCPGADDFVAVVLAAPYTERDGANVQVLVETTSGNSGWRLSWAYGQLQVDVCDGAGSFQSVALSTISHDARAQAGRLHAIGVRVRQVGGFTELGLWIGPARKGVFTGPNAGVTPATAGTFRVGYGTTFGAVAVDAAVLGVAYYDGTLTDDVLRMVLGKAAVTGILPTDVVTWSTAWVGTAFVGVPSSVPATVGSGTLTKQGSPTAIAGYFPA